MSKIRNNIIIGGTGQVAWALCRMLVRAGIPVKTVLGRTDASASKLASELGASSRSWMDAKLDRGDCLLLAVKDDAIADCASLLWGTDAFVFHCAGAVSHRVLEGCGPHVGVIYPLQSLRKDIRLPDVIPFLITTSTPEAALVAESFVSGIGSTWLHVSDEERLRYHLAAVMVNNLTNHLFTLTDEFCKQENIAFAQLIPLIQETTARLNLAAPQDLQTGPAVRGDNSTREAHERLLEAYPDLLAWYQLSWDQIRARRS